MANENIEFDIVVNGKKAKASIDGVEKSQKDLEKTVAKSTKSMSDSWIMLGAKIAATTYAMKATIETYKLQIKAETALQSAMKNNINLLDDNIENWKKYASELQNTSNIGDEVTLQQLAFLNTLGLTDDKMKQITNTAADLKNAGFMEVESATRNLAKTLSGMQGELGELFPQLKNLTVEALKAGEGIEVIAKAVKGQSEAMANSPIGKWDALWNDAGDTLEMIGKFSLSVLDSLKIMEFGSWGFKKLGDGFKALSLRVESLGLHIEWVFATIRKDSEAVDTLNSKIEKVTKAYNAIYDTPEKRQEKLTEALEKQIRLKERLNKLDEPMATNNNPRANRKNTRIEEKEKIKAELLELEKEINELEISLAPTVNVRKVIKKTDLDKLDDQAKDLKKALETAFKTDLISLTQLKTGLADIDTWVKDVKVSIGTGLGLSEAIEKARGSTLDSVKVGLSLDEQTLIDDVKAMKNSIIESMKSNEITPEEALFAVDAVKQWAADVQAVLDSGDFTLDEAMAAVGNSFDELEPKMSEFDIKLQSLAMDGIGQLSDAFVDMALTGKSSFREMAADMVASLAKVIAKQMLLNAVKAMGFSFISHTGTSEVKHTGGQIGTAPTYHNGKGMMPDERMIKAQVGEAIINRSGATNNREAIKAMNAGYKIDMSKDNEPKSAFQVPIINNNNYEYNTTSQVAPIVPSNFITNDNKSSKTNVVNNDNTSSVNNAPTTIDNTTKAEIIFNVQAIDASSFNGYLQKEKATIENIINRSISTNGSVRKTINQSV